MRLTFVFSILIKISTLSAQLNLDSVLFITDNLALDGHYKESERIVRSELSNQEYSLCQVLILSNQLASILNIQRKTNDAIDLLLEIDMPEITYCDTNSIFRYYNSLASSYSEINNSIAERYFNKAEEYLDQDSIFTELHGEFYNNIGYNFDKLGKLDEALSAYYKAFHIDTTVFGYYHQYNATDLTNIAYIYDLKSDFLNAIKYHKRALKIKLRVLRKDHPKLAYNYNGLGAIYNLLGNKKKSKEYYKEALRIREAQKNGINPGLAVSYRNVGNSYNNEGKYDDALRFYKKAESIENRLFTNTKPYWTGITAHLISQAYSGLKDSINQLKYLRQSYDILRHRDGVAKKELSITTNSLGHYYFNKRDYKKALTFFRLASKHSLQYNDLESLYHIQIRFQIANTLKALGQYNDALIIINDLINISQESRSWIDNPVIIDIYRIKAECLTSQTYISNKDSIVNYRKALEQIEVGINKLHSLNNTISYLEDKYDLSSKQTNIFDHGLQILLTLDAIDKSKSYLKQIYKHISKGKNQQIRLSQQKSKNIFISSNTEPIYQNYYDKILKAAKLASLIDQDSGESQRIVKERQLFKINSIVDSLEQIIGKQAFLNTNETINQEIDFVQDEVIRINYHILDSIIYIITQDQNEYNLYKQNIDFNIVELIDEIMNSFQLTHIDSLTKVLLPENINWSLYTDIVIEPDGVLARVPFEILLIDGRHLIQSKIVSYATPYSTNNEGKYDHLYSGFAPNFEDELILINNKKEIDHGYFLFGGLQFKGEQVSKEIFIENLGAQIVHIATHAKMNISNPFISSIQLGNQENITFREISVLPIQSELLILNSCDSGNGKVSDGEGLLHLASAFSMAGVNSIVTSLWKADDYSSHIIIKNFLTLLKDGLSKNQALREAKLIYLKNAKTEALKHPKYWANLVLIGDPKPLIKDQFLYNHTWLWVLGVLLTIVTALFLLKIKRGLNSYA